MPKMPHKTLNLKNLTSDRHPLEFGFSRHGDPDEQVFDVHFELEIGVVLEGEMERHWEGETRTLNPGQVWLSSVWEPHGFKLRAVPCRVAVFLPRPEMLFSIDLGLPRSTPWHALFFLPPNERPQLSKAEGRYILTRLSRLEELTKRNPPYAERDAVPAMIEILNSLLQHRGDSAPPSSRLQTMGSIQRAVELVFETTSPVPEARAAAACAMSLTTFRRRFKENMGLSFGRFGLNHRLKMASRDLLDGSPVKEIAEKWSFSDLSHFYRAFKKVFAVTPKEYRERGRGDI